MSTVISPHVTRFTIFNTLFAGLVLYMFISLLVTDNEKFEDGVKAELTQVSEVLAPEEWERLDLKTKLRHQALLFDTGLFNTVKHAFLPIESNAVGAAVFKNDWNYRFVYNFQIIFYQLMHRIVMLEYWLLMMIPVAVAIIGNGYYDWKKKQYQFGGASQNYTRVALKSIWAALVLLSVFIVTPNFFGYYIMYAPIVLIVIFSTSISYIISSFQKSS